MSRPRLLDVVGAAPPLRPTLTLHGGMFGLGVNRPRLFESNVLILTARWPRAVDAVGVYGKGPDGRQLWKRSEYFKANGNLLFRAPRSLAEAQQAMGMDWADWHGTKEAIPPAYTQFIGEQLLDHLRVCRECGGTPAGCRRSRIKCCPDCTHTRADLEGVA